MVLLIASLVLAADVEVTTSLPVPLLEAQEDPESLSPHRAFL
jgi:hypothetical protein